MTEKLINRRALTQGVAWSAPIVIASSTIPAYAASPEPELYTHGGVTWNKPFDGYNSSIDGNRLVRVYTMGNRGDYFGEGFGVKNLRAGDVVTDYTAIFYLPMEAASFEADQGGANGWTTLRASGEYVWANNQRYYVYKTTYPTAITSTGTSVTLPAFSFKTVYTKSQIGSFYVDISATVRGKKLSVQRGPISVR